MSWRVWVSIAFGTSCYRGPAEPPPPVPAQPHRVAPIDLGDDDSLRRIDEYVLLGSIPRYWPEPTMRPRSVDERIDHPVPVLRHFRGMSQVVIEAENARLALWVTDDSIRARASKPDASRSLKLPVLEAPRFTTPIRLPIGTCLFSGLDVATIIGVTTHDADFAAHELDHEWLVKLRTELGTVDIMVHRSVEDPAVFESCLKR